MFAQVCSKDAFAFIALHLLKQYKQSCTLKLQYCTPDPDLIYMESRQIKSLIFDLRLVRWLEGAGLLISALLYFMYFALAAGYQESLPKNASGPGVNMFEMLAIFHLVADVGRQVAAHEGPDLVGELAFFWRESEVHGALPGGVLIGPEFSGEAASDKRREIGWRLSTPRSGTTLRRFFLT